MSDALENLAVRPPVAPMLAKAAKELPVGEGFAYEPKWDSNGSWACT